MQQLKRAHLNPSILTTFYRVAIESVLTSSISLWYENSTTTDKEALRRVVRTAEKVIGVTLPFIQDLAPKHLLAKSTSILEYPSVPCHGTFSLLPSGKDSAACVEARFRNSFYLAAMRLLNTTAHC